MKVVQLKATDDMRMSAAEFDRIMARALQVKPETTKAKRASATVKSRKRVARRKK